MQMTPVYYQMNVPVYAATGYYQMNIPVADPPVYSQMNIPVPEHVYFRDAPSYSHNQMHLNNYEHGKGVPVYNVCNNKCL